MKKITSLFLITMYSLSLVSMDTQSTKHPTHLVLTTALIEKNAEARKQEYIKSLQAFTDMGYKKPFIVEGVQSQGPSFFEDYTDTDHIYYYPHNNPQDKNRGKFEGLSLAGALKQFGFDEHDIIYKQTGRYLGTKNLADIAKEYPGFDAYVKKHTDQGYVLLVAYLFRKAPLLEMFDTLDYDAMERTYDTRHPEKVEPMIENYVTKYVQQQEQEKKLKVFYIQDTLGVLANPSYSSTGVPLDSPTEY